MVLGTIDLGEGDYWLIQDPPEYVGDEFAASPPTPHTLCLVSGERNLMLVATCLREKTRWRRTLRRLGVARVKGRRRRGIAGAGLGERVQQQVEKRALYSATCTLSGTTNFAFPDALHRFCHCVPAYHALEYSGEGRVGGLDGLLYKTDSKGRKWTARWFVLNPVHRTLKYFKDSKNILYVCGWDERVGKCFESGCGKWCGRVLSGLGE